MKSNELRLGNYVDTINISGDVHLPNNKPLKLGPISFFEVELYHIEESFAEQFIPPKTSMQELIPIPLTEEWLVKFGFVYTEIHEGFNQYRNDSLDLSITPNGFEIFFDIRWIKIEYVHQLQNLYFSLTNVELTTKE